MRKTFSGHELPHIWAAQKQEEGRSSSMFFDGPVIYSYGRHFPIARILPGSVVLFTSKGYSTTTAKHKSVTMRALSASFRVFVVPNVLAETSTDHETNAAALLAEYTEAHDKALRAHRYAGSYAASAVESAKEAAYYCREFKLKGKTLRAACRAAAKPFTAKEDEIIRAKVARSSALEAAAEARREAEAAERAKELIPALEAWAAGTGEYRSGFYALPCRLRVVTVENNWQEPRMVETSHGASVALTDAVRLLGAWQAGTVEIGQKIGPYTVEAVTPESIKIGCHDISRTEAERVIVPAAGTK